MNSETERGTEGALPDRLQELFNRFEYYADHGSTSRYDRETFRADIGEARRQLAQYLNWYLRSTGQDGVL